MKRGHERVEINIEELRGVLDRAREEPISATDYAKLKLAIDVLAERLTRKRSTEKTRTVVPQPQLTPNTNAPSSTDKCQRR
jgi:hypothetical protein